MKIKVTLMTENDKHFNGSVEEATFAAASLWNDFIAIVNAMSGENTHIENIEIIEK